MSQPTMREMHWELNGLHLAGLAWGDSTNPPLLALHGWLDNAASFALLAPQLADQFYVVAPDLTGHGQSGWRAPEATYQVYDDLPQIHALVQHLGWGEFDLLGHSRGAIISSLYTASFPEQVRHLVLLDGVSPPPLEAAQFPGQMRRFVLERQRLLNRHYKVFTTQEQAVAVREEQGLERTAAELIARRNLRSVEGGFSWSTDPRLRGASAVKMTTEQIDAVLGSLTMPTLLLIAENGLATSQSDKFVSLANRIPGGHIEIMPGGHHFHMEKGVTKLGQRMMQFLSPPD